MRKFFTLLFLLLSFTGKARNNTALKFDEKSEKASLIFSGKLLWHATTGNLPDSLVLVATDVWKGRFFKGDTVFILNDLNGGGITEVQNDEEYLIYSWANMIIPYAESKPVWSTTETEKLDEKYKNGFKKHELINGILFTTRGAGRVRTIFSSAELCWSDSLNPLEPVILYNEKMVSLLELSQTNFYTSVELLKPEMDYGKETKCKEAYYLKIKDNALRAQRKNGYDKMKRKIAKLFNYP